jgi:hypothetical protein
MRVLAVFALVAAATEATAEATAVALFPPTESTFVADCVPLTSPERLPEKFVAVTAVVALVAVLAFPFSAAVMVPAEKFPLASRSTRVLGVLSDVPDASDPGSPAGPGSPWSPLSPLSPFSP